MLTESVLGLRLYHEPPNTCGVVSGSPDLGSPLTHMHLVGCPWTLLHELAWPRAGLTAGSEHFGLLERVR